MDGVIFFSVFAVVVGGGKHTVVINVAKQAKSMHIGRHKGDIGEKKKVERPIVTGRGGGGWEK